MNVPTDISLQVVGSVAAALLVAALGAEGESTIGGLRHIDRGYERPEETLRALGAEIERIPGPDTKEN